MSAIDDYLAMAHDPVRAPAYLAAMASVIRPGDRVLELGTGFGYFAVHACRLGARHVIAVEPDDAVGHGRAFAEANGCADRITFVQGLSSRYVPSERADVLVEDLRGVSPVHRDRLDVLRDAADRLLVPSARRIPFADDLLVALSDVPADLPRLMPEQATELHGISVAPIRALLDHALHRTRGDASSLLAEGRVWARLDYGALAAGDPSGTAEWTVTRAGRLAGLVSWFRAELAVGIGFDTGPHAARTAHDRAFLPIGAPIVLAAGDHVRVTVRTRFDGVEPLWAWEVEVTHASGGTERRRCSDLLSRAMSAARRTVRAADHRPQRTPALERLAVLLSAVDGAASLGELAARMRAADPRAFPSEQAALRWTGEELAGFAEDPAP